MPVVLAMLVGVLTVEGTGPGLAAGAIAVATLIVLAVRARPRGSVEVAGHRDADRRVLVVGHGRGDPEAAARVAELAGEAADVRLLVPVRSRRLERWLSAEDDARADAQRRLAHAAGALVAAGLPVSGSVGRLRPGPGAGGRAARLPGRRGDRAGRAGEPKPLGEAAERLELPLDRVSRLGLAGLAIEGVLRAASRSRCSER